MVTRYRERRSAPSTWTGGGGGSAKSRLAAPRLTRPAHFKSLLPGVVAGGGGGGGVCGPGNWHQSLPNVLSLYSNASCKTVESQSQLLNLISASSTHYSPRMAS